MFCWRITKYNPRYRNKYGAYTKDEWTCYSEIGKKFDGIVFTLDDYVETENKYINAVMLIMECLNINALKILTIEQHGKRIKELFLEHALMVRDGDLINKEHIKSIVRLVLRNILWCRLETHDMYVHIGYDYYLYVGSRHPCKKTIKAIERTGLFVEEYESPYHAEE